MGNYKKFTFENRWEVVDSIIKKELSVHSAALNFSISKTVINDWLRKYNASGIEGLRNGKGWKIYSEDTKLLAVEDVIIRGLSKHSTVKKYEISSRNVLERWIKCYNSGNKLRDTGPRKEGTTVMTKGRRTTYEERVEIVQYTIVRDLDYATAMEKYGVSYQQLYSWVRKYQSGGAEALKDGRGRNKQPEELTEVELLNLRIKELEARNEYLEIENAIEKKLAELHRRYESSH